MVKIVLDFFLKVGYTSKSMKKGYSHISIVLDRSGSMTSCESETREGFNTFITKQKEASGVATASLVQFDDHYELNYAFLPIGNVPLLTNENYQPRGNTALLDAIGRTIKETGEKLAAMPEYERPERVLFVIQTDGFENASSKFTRNQVFDAIKHQQEAYQWDFIFLGANQDAIATAATFGINAKSSLSYTGNNSRGVFLAAADYTTNFRSAETLCDMQAVSFSEKERADAVAPENPTKTDIITK